MKISLPSRLSARFVLGAAVVVLAGPCIALDRLPFFSLRSSAGKPPQDLRTRGSAPPAASSATQSRSIRIVVPRHVPRLPLGASSAVGTVPLRPNTSTARNPRPVKKSPGKPSPSVAPAAQEKPAPELQAAPTVSDAVPSMAPSSNGLTSPPPFAQPVPAKAGLVYSPGMPPSRDTEVDVTGYAPGEVVRDPRSGALFRVP